MSSMTSKIAQRFEKLSIMQQTILLLMIALVATEALVCVFYSIFFSDRLLLDLVLSGVIVILVGYPLGYFVVSQNMKLRRMAMELDRAARLDDLTSLANRRTFFVDAERAMSESAGSRGALLYIDVDHFKKLNDSCGHAAGDAVLRELGEAILRSVRKGDIAARLGGEEFAVYLADADPSVAIDVAERIRARAASIGGQFGIAKGDVTVSIGLELRANADDLMAIMLRADRKLYAAKSGGRNRIVSDGSLAA